MEVRMTDIRRHRFEVRDKETATHGVVLIEYTDLDALIKSLTSVIAAAKQERRTVNQLLHWQRVGREPDSAELPLK
jgi:hypothetical protein